MCDESVLDVSQGQYVGSTEVLCTLSDHTIGTLSRGWSTIDLRQMTHMLLGGGLGARLQIRATSSSDVNEAEEEQVTLKNKCSIVICTGANASGNSIYLKQTALICFMAQVRSH